MRSMTAAHQNTGSCSDAITLIPHLCHALVALGNNVASTSRHSSCELFGGHDGPITPSDRARTNRARWTPIGGAPGPSTLKVRGSRPPECEFDFDDANVGLLVSEHPGPRMP